MTMAYEKRSYMEHVAIHVRDLDWHIRFFKEALGMTLRDESQYPSQVWTIGGIQLVKNPSFDGPEGRMAHLGVMTEDLEAALEAVYQWDVTEMPQGRNWVQLPDGLCVEIMQAARNSVDEALAVQPR
jgi:catechol 2,3-dioxygenase-like lactoylglutathione lyase family enzyme